MTASAEYALARAAGFGEWTAGALPAALTRHARHHRLVPAIATHRPDLYRP